MRFLTQFDYFLNYRNVQATLLFTFSKQNITKQHFEAKMSKFYKWLSDFNTRDKYPFDYNSSSKTFWCQPCEQAVPAVQKSQLKQHLESEKHRKNLGLKRSLVQSRLEFQDPKKQCISRQEQVNQDLCNAFLAANIPLNKLNYPVLKDCLEKNIGLAIAGVDTFRQKYVPKSYEIAMEHIKEDLDGKNVWMSIDETTDSVGRKVANVILGELNAEGYCKPYLVKCTYLAEANGETIARLANDTLTEVWPGFNKDLLKVLVSDAAAYMLKAGNMLKVFYPKVFHVTCLCHGLHRVCELIREKYPTVNELISTCKKVFLKAPSRIQMFKERYPNLALPPQPVLTR